MTRRETIGRLVGSAEAPGLPRSQTGRRRIAIVVTLVLCVPLGQADANPPTADLRACLPAGWSVTELPAQSGPQGQPAAPEDVHLRALKLRQDGRPDAGIDLTRVRRSGEQRVDPGVETAAVKATIIAGYEKAGFAAECEDDASTALGTLDASQMNCFVRRGSEPPLLGQRILLAFGRAAVYSLSYSASPELHPTYQDQFEATRLCLGLE